MCYILITFVISQHILIMYPNYLNNVIARHFIASVAVEVVGGSARVGHSMYIRALVHVGHTRSLSVHVAHHRMMCAYITERGSRGYYIMCTKGDLVLSLCYDGRERL